jgi:hypothetical protein
MNFLKDKFKSGGEKKMNSGDKKISNDNKGRNQGTSMPRGEKPPQKDDRPKNSPGKTQQKGNPKSARNAQSALRPGNTSGVVKQKEHPMVQFGPILKEFLSSKELVNKGVTVKYDQVNDHFDIAVSFKRVLPNGVSTSSEINLKIEDYLVQRKSLLKVKDDSSQYRDFVIKLIDRLGVDITHAKPSVQMKSVERFVLKHLSPVERAILSLTDDDFNRIDTSKIPFVMEPSLSVIKENYGGIEKRSQFLVMTINTEGPTTDLEPPNWALKGVTGFTKGMLMETLKVIHTPQITDEQQQVIDSLATSLFGSDPASASASQKSEDYKKEEEE